MASTGGFTGKFKHEPTEIERVQANISQTEMQIQRKLTQIGQMYYQDNLYAVSIEPKYRQLIDEVNRLDENRKGFFAHKLRLEGNMACANCGKVIPYGSVFCPFCNKRADVKEMQEPVMIQPQMSTVGKTCVSCGTICTDADSRFCITCGSPL